MTFFRKRKIFLYRNKPTSTKTAILCFLSENDIKHRTNHSKYEEFDAIVSALVQCNYRVYIVSYNERLVDKNIKKIAELDLVLGFGWSFYDLYFLSDAKMIAYGTGSSNTFQNRAELRRVKEFNSLFGSKAVPKRLIKDPLTDFFELASIVLLIGNSVTRSTYTFRDDQVVVMLRVPVKRIGLKDIKTSGNGIISSIPRRILFLGSQGSILKGLHRLIHYCSNRDVEAIVVGNVDSEVLKLCEAQPNIRLVGFVSLESNTFRSAVSECGFVYFDSGSEGMSGSLATAMVCGLIPIASINSGVDLDLSYSFIISDNNYLSVLDSAMKASEEELLEKKKNLERFTAEYFNHMDFKASIINELKKL